MVAKAIKLDGYGTVMLQSINIKEKEFETVDVTGEPVERKTIYVKADGTVLQGVKSKAVHLKADGTEVPNSSVCKKIEIEGEEIIAGKFDITKEVPEENITVLDDNGIIYRGIDRKFYNVVTDNEKIKDLVINQNKSLEFPFVAGGGYKIWKAVLTNWNGKLLMVCCRGDIAKELEKYSEDTVEIEIEVMPQHKNMKKMLKAMVM